MRHIELGDLDELENRVKHALELERDEASSVAEFLQTALHACFLQLVREHLNLAGRDLILVDSEALPVKREVVTFVILPVDWQLALAETSEVIAVLGSIDHLTNDDLIIVDLKAPRNELELA